MLDYKERRVRVAAIEQCFTKKEGLRSVLRGKNIRKVFCKERRFRVAAAVERCSTNKEC